MMPGSGRSVFSPLVSLLGRLGLGRTRSDPPGWPWVVLPVATLLLANVLRSWFPGLATDVLFGLAVLVLGLSLWRPRAPWPWAVLCCFAALAVPYGLGLAVAFSVEGARNLAAILCAALIFLFGFRYAPELARRRSPAAMLLVGAAALFPLYLAPTGLHPHSIAWVFGYSLLAAGLLLSVQGRQAWMHVAFGLAVVAGLVFGSRSFVLAALAGHASYWTGRFVLQDRVRATAMVAGLGVLIGVLVFALPGFRSTTALANLDRLFFEATDENVGSGREVLWSVALSRIAEAPWLGHGPDAHLIPSIERSAAAESPDEGERAAARSCPEQSSPGLAADCTLLLELRPILTGPGGDRRQLWTWSAHTPLHEWRGVVLGGKPLRVTELRLPGVGLTGRIPPRIEGLDGLQALDLADNWLAGPIPPELGKLRALRFLRLSNNRLAGPVPPELGKLRALSELRLEDNRLNGVAPAALARLDRLSVLRLSGNEFAAPFPNTLYAVSSNDLDRDLLCLPTPRTPPGLLADCTALLAMRDVLAGDARLDWRQSAPIRKWNGVGLGREPLRVTKLRPHGFGLNGRIPPELARLDALRILRLEHNRLAGPIPPELGKLRNLRRLNLHENHLTGPIPAELGKLRALSELRLKNNRLNGAVPAALTRLDGLSVLRLSGNEFTAPYPAPLHAVPDHDLHRDLLCLPTSRTPPELLADCTALLALRDVLAGDARLDWRESEPLDSWQGVALGGDPLRVITLWLPWTRLNGRIPPRLGELAGLQLVNLAHNQLAGPIPATLGRLRGLRLLVLDGNHLTGPIPPELGSLAALSELWLSANRLDGVVPATLARLDRLSTLRLSGNEFAAPFPAPLYAVANHDLFGELFCLPMPGPRMPTELLRDCTALLAMRHILAGEARLDWRESESLDLWQGVELGGDPLRVTGLWLRRADLDGRLPPQIEDLDALEVIDLGHNRLTGPIPPALEGLEALSELRLEDNRLNGVVPAALARLDRLSVLRLSGNEFTAPYPAPLHAVPDHDLHRDLLCLPTSRTPPELLADCTALLALRDVLAGEARLDWRESEPLGSWQGVELGGDPLRVTGLRLSWADLNGRIPPELARLDALEVVHLDGNPLTGPIPPALGELRNLAKLVLPGNRLAGPTPPELLPVADRGLHGEPRCRSAVRTGRMMRDCRALLEARDVLAGGAVLNWDESTPMQHWTGVVMSPDHGYVVALELSGAGLRGRLAPALGGLEQLESLRLDHNRLTGPIPPELGRLSHLRELALDANALTGAIPAELAQLASLTALSLRDNGLHGAVPPALAELHALESLNLGGNDFSGPLSPALTKINHDVGDDLRCSSVPYLDLARDCAILLAVRDTLAGDAVLNWRDDVPIGLWRGVRLAGEPTRVVSLHLPESGLDGEIPPELGRLTGLAALRLDGNRLTGPIPAALSRPRRMNLTELRLENNRLSGPAPGPGLPRYSLVSVGGNRFDDAGDPAPAETGGEPRPVAPPVPEAAGKTLMCRPSAAPAELLADCEALLAARTVLVGEGGASPLNWTDSIPVGFWRGVTLSAQTPPRVVAVDLSRMGLSGRISPEWGKLEELRSLRLHRNRLCGPIPSELGALGKLRELVLGMNALTGPVPPELGQLEQLRFLHLRRNRLTGSIPPELGALAHLRTLALDANALTGPIPAALAELAGLDELWLDGNRLSGGVPEALAAPGRLSVLAFDGDGAEMGGGRDGLSYCEAASGQDDGLAHDCAVLLAVREALDGNARLGWDPAMPLNYWQGVELSGEPVRVTGLDLAGAGLNGTIPPELHALDRLVALRLSGNAFTGSIPPELGKLAHLQVLALDGNALTGAIPPEVVAIPGLRELRLEGNALGGPVPALPGGLSVLRMGTGEAPAAAQGEDVPPPPPRWRCRPSVLGDAALLGDCTLLLEVRDRLAGDVALNWNETTPIDAWQGVTVGGSPERVVAVELPGMGLNGRLPWELSALRGLASLRLEDNRLTGVVPGALGRIPDLAVLQLGGNDFSGCVPRTLAGVQGRDLELDLLCAPWAGARPKLYDDMAALMSARDALAGSAELDWDSTRPVAAWQGVSLGGDPPRVVELDLSGAGLDGRIPASLGALERLAALRLGGNRLAGSIPAQLGDLEWLQWLELNDNRLTGAVPPELGNLQQLRRLWIENNQLGGDLPPELDGLPALRSAWLYGNRFTGCIPPRLQRPPRTLAASLGLPVCGTPDGDAQGAATEPFGAAAAEIGERLPTSRAAPRVSMSTHNLFLQVGLQTGIVGMAALAALFASLIVGLVGSREAVIGPTRCLALAVAVTLTVHSAFEVFLLQDNVVVSTIAWLLAGLGAGMARAGRDVLSGSPADDETLREAGNRLPPAG